MSIRDKIFAAQDIPSELVEVPLWGVTVEVRGLSGSERTRLLDAAVNAETGEIDLRSIYPQIVIGSCFDPETGERVFQDDDQEALLSKSAQALDVVAAVGLRLGGFTKEESDAAAKRFPDES